MSACPTVYLAGAIAGLSHSGATSWRDQARDALSATGITAFSPMRGKDFLKDMEVLSNHGYPHPLSTNKAITTRDRCDCMGCDAILMNLLGATRVSIGTSIEIGWADAARVPIVLVMEKTGNPHDHCMVREMCGFQVETLEEGIATVKAILLP